MEKKFIVYEHLFPNGKRYIGITSKNPKQRWENGSGYTKLHQSAMYYAINKYGWDNIQHNILLKNLSFEEAKKKEIELIKKYNTFVHNENSNGYNMTLGGEGVLGRVVTEEQKDKMRKAKKGKTGNLCPNSKKVIADGIIYESITDFCNKNNLLRGTVECWLNGKNKMPQQWLAKDLKLLEKEDKRILSPQEKPHKMKVKYENMIFNSQRELANYLNISTSTLCNWLSGKQNIPLEFQNKNIGFVDNSLNDKIKFSERKHQKTKVVYDDVVYDSQVELSRKIGIKKATINAWLKNKNKMPLYIQEKGLKYYK